MVDDGKQTGHVHCTHQHTTVIHRKQTMCEVTYGGQSRSFVIALDSSQQELPDEAVVCFSFISSFPYFLSHLFKIQKIKGVWHFIFSNLIIVILIDIFLFKVFFNWFVFLFYYLTFGLMTFSDQILFSFFLFRSFFFYFFKFHQSTFYFYF